MKGLTLKSIEALEKLVDERFDPITLEFLGLIPKISREKKIIFSTSKNSLTSLFLQSLGTKDPNKSEEDTLKSLLRIANGYIESLKQKTKAKVTNRIDGYIRDKTTKDKKIDAQTIHGMFNEEIDSAKNHFKLIANCESSKAANMGTALQIAKVGASQGIDDPVVFYIVSNDERTCSECKRVYLLPDGVTPRTWRLSELSHGYHKKGDPTPSISGNHPNERCAMAFLAPNWGFNEGGYVAYKGKGWDELKNQREKYGKLQPLSLKKSYQDNYGNWRFDNNDKAGMEHPDNQLKENKFDHKIAHQANNGKLVWKQKHMIFKKKPVTAQDMDSTHRKLWNIYDRKNNLQKNPEFRNTLLNLNKQIINDNDRHLHLSGTSIGSNPKHTEMRQRHLIQALGGEPGYSIEDVRHPQTNQHLGVRIKAERHPHGKKAETSWLFDGKSLITEYDKFKK
ncbi:MAG TPA: hypothetical protein VI911_11730 [Patescibacteria group bacterium]|nr:hypothetical protein [Patescibacteria group bacterium]